MYLRMSLSRPTYLVKANGVPRGSVLCPNVSREPHPGTGASGHRSIASTIGWRIHSIAPGQGRRVQLRPAVGGCVCLWCVEPARAANDNWKRQAGRCVWLVLVMISCLGCLVIVLGINYKSFRTYLTTSFRLCYECELSKIWAYQIHI